MAFGPATTDIEQTLLALLEGRNPSPLAPVPLAPTNEIGPLDFDTTAALAALQPQPVPPALPGPVNADAIRAPIMAQLGPEPVAPAIEPTPLILRVARALQGFGAGVQGQGPQFLAGLREEAEAPQREFRARKERFDTRKQELGLIAEQAVLTAEDRRMARTMDLLDRQAERDFQESLKRSGIKSQEAIARMKESFDLERDVRKAEAERVEQERKDIKERKQAVTALANTLVDDFRVTRPEARRFAEYELNGAPLSKADAKKYSRIEKYRPSATGTIGGGSGASSSAIQNTISEFETLKNLAIQAVKARGGSVQDETEAVRKATAGVVRKMARRPDLFEVGSGVGGYLYAKPRQGEQPQFSSSPAQQPQEQQMYFDLSGGGPSVGPQAQAGPTKIISIGEIRALAREAGQNEAEAIEDFKRRGYAIAAQK